MNGSACGSQSEEVTNHVINRVSYYLSCLARRRTNAIQSAESNGRKEKRRERKKDGRMGGGPVGGMQPGGGGATEINESL